MDQRRIIFIIPPNLVPGDLIYSDINSIAGLYGTYHYYQPEVWSVGRPDFTPFLDNIIQVPLHSTSLVYLKQMISERKLLANHTVVCTYGSWQHPTRLGYEMSRMGFHWVHHPFKELGHCWLDDKYRSYWTLYEKPMIEKAAILRTITFSEYCELSDLFPGKCTIKYIPIDLLPATPDLVAKNGNPRIILYKVDNDGINAQVDQLLEAWRQFNWMNCPYELVFGIQNEGLFREIWRIGDEIGVKHCDIKLIHNPQEEKAILDQSSFLITLSRTSKMIFNALKSMAHGLIPIVPNNNKLTSIIGDKFGVYIEPDGEGLANAFRAVFSYKTQEILAKQLLVADYVDQHHSIHLLFK